MGLRLVRLRGPHGLPPPCSISGAAGLNKNRPLAAHGWTCQTAFT